VGASRMGAVVGVRPAQGRSSAREARASSRDELVAELATAALRARRSARLYLQDGQGRGGHGPSWRGKATV
jgi:hypothetical protein